MLDVTKIKDTSLDQAERIMSMEKLVRKMAKDATNDQAQRIMAMEKLIMKMATKLDVNDIEEI